MKTNIKLLFFLLWHSIISNCTPRAYKFMKYHSKRACNYGL